MILTFPPIKHYHPFQPGPFRMAMNLFPLDLVEWIEVDTDLPAHLAEKQRLLAERPTEVFAAQPQALAGSQETLALTCFDGEIDVPGPSGCRYGIITAHQERVMELLYQIYREGANFASR